MALGLRHPAGPLVPYWASFAAVWGLIGLESEVHLGLVLVALGLQVAVGIALTFRKRWDHRRWAGIAGVVAFLVSIALLRHAVGPRAGAYGGLVLLPVVWAALRSRHREFGVALAGAAVLLLVPLVVVGGERYPASGWRGGVLFVVVCAVIGITVLLLVDRMRRNERQYRLLADNSTDLVARFDLDGNVIYASPASRALLGYEPEELVGLQIADLMHPEEGLGRDQNSRGADAPGGPVALTRRLRHRDGRWLWFEATVRAVHDSTGAVVEHQAAIRLVEDRVRAEHQIANQQGDLLAVARIARTLAHETDPRQIPPTVCAAVCDLTDTRTAALWRLQHDGSLMNIGAHGMNQLRVALAPGRGEHPPLQCAREQRPVFVPEAVAWAGSDIQPTGTGSQHFEPLVVDGDLLGVLAVSWDHTMTELPERSRVLFGLLADEAATAMQRAGLLQRLGDLARTDALTGLLNRRGWDERAGGELERARRDGHAISIALLDLDHFKKYNDDRGHQAGDHLLKTLAAEWTQELRSTDVLCRWGGEEFVVLMVGCELDSAHDLVERLRKLVPDGQTCSVGLARWDRKATIEGLVRSADTALYDAKGAGRDQIITV